MIRAILLLIAVLWSGHANAQTAFLDKREFSAKSGRVRVKLGVSHDYKKSVRLTVRLKAAGVDDQTPGSILAESVRIVPEKFKIPRNKFRNVLLTFEPAISTRTPYFVCVIYQPVVERIDRNGRAGGSMLLATESCSRFWVVP